MRSTKYATVAAQGAATVAIVRPIKIIETERDDFDGPIGELWRGETFIGMTYWDGSDVILNIYPDDNGEVHDLSVNELQMVLDTAVRIVDPDALDSEMEELREAAGVPQWSDDGDHPATLALLAEFDDKVTYRNEDGEGFFARSVAPAFIAKCEELDLAVTEMEGLEWDGTSVTADPELVLDVAEQPMMTWSEFRSYANATCLNTLQRWPSRDTVLVAFVFTQPDGEEIVA